MDGILIIDKPMGLTSHDVVSRVRRILNTKRVGHTGTLDPFATGVLVLLIGKATRLAQFLDKDEKEYEATVKFGYETDTGDRTGQEREKAENTGQSRVRERAAESMSSLDYEVIEHALEKFRGQIDQVPPMFSAKKVEGKKLYELARKGQEIERKAVTVTISRLEILDDSEEPGPQADGSSVPTDTVKLKVVCSAGSYVRTLAEDIGRELGVGAHLQELRRTRAGKFAISQSSTLETLEQRSDPVTAILPINEAVSHLPAMHLPADRVDRTRDGLASRYEGAASGGEAIQMLTPEGELAAIGIYNAGENIVQPKVVLI